jgi:hypothetical protein
VQAYGELLPDKAVGNRSILGHGKLTRREGQEKRATLPLEEHEEVCLNGYQRPLYRPKLSRTFIKRLQQ